MTTSKRVQAYLDEIIEVSKRHGLCLVPDNGYQLNVFDGDNAMLERIEEADDCTPSCSVCEKHGPVTGQRCGSFSALVCERHDCRAEVERRDLEIRTDWEIARLRRVAEMPINDTSVPLLDRLNAFASKTSAEVLSRYAPAAKAPERAEHVPGRDCDHCCDDCCDCVL